MNRQALLLLGVLFMALHLPGQPAGMKCLTPPVRSEWLARYQAQPSSVTLRNDDLQYIPVTVHLVADNDGFSSLDQVDILDAFCKLNEDFAPANIRFFLNGIRQVNNSSYYEHSNFFTSSQMMNKHNVWGTVNTYFVEKAFTEDACGYNLLNSQSKESFGIVLANSCTNSYNSNWAHEMGHYLSLLHTFHGWEAYQHNYNQAAPHTVNQVEVEMADGSNCLTGGDGFCDTPADYLNGRWFCDQDGQSQISQMDPSGAKFQSDGHLFMSYSFDGCPDRFSPDQISAMRQYLIERRNDHLYDEAPFSEPKTSELQLRFPPANGFVDIYDEVTFHWDAVPNATGYILEISRLPNFAFIHGVFYIRNTQLVIKDLLPGKTYYWRVRPINELFTCTGFTMAQSFVTGSVTDAASLPDIDQLSAAPNPVRAGEIPRLFLSHQNPFAGTLILSDLNGKTIWQSTIDLPPGSHQIPLNGIPDVPGVYALTIANDRGSTTLRVVITR